MAGKNIYLPLISGVDPKGFNEAQAQLRALGSSIKGFARNVITAFGGVSATVASVNFLQSAITQSRDLERQTASLKSVFGATSAEMMAFAKTGVNMGLSTADAAKASTFLGSVLKSAGFSMEDTSAKTKTLVGLAADLATTYGYDVSEALTGMTALFRGEYDPIEKFGVAMKQSEVNTILAARQQKNLTGQELLHAQQLIRLELLMQRTADAQGAYTRQGGSLFVQQTKLNALWKDMQATVGQQLTPALANFLEKLTPIVQNFAPNLEKIFATFGDLIDRITPKLDGFAEKFATAFDNFGNFLGGILPLLEGMLSLVLDNINQIIAFTVVFKGLRFATSLTVGAITAFEAATKLATVATKELTLAQMATGWGAIAVALGLVVTGLVQIGIEMANNTDKLKRLKDTATTGWVAGQSRYAADAAQPFDAAKSIKGIGKGMSSTIDQFLAQDAKNADKIKSASTGTGAGGGGGTKQAIKTFFDNLYEEVDKQALRIKLSGLGATEGLVDAVLGSSTWEATAKKIIAGGTKAVDYVQRQFNKTKAGIDEVAKAAEEAAKKLDDYNKKVQEATDFSTGLGDVLKGLNGSAVTESLGAFEQQIVSTFESITSKVQDAVKSELIHPEDAQALLSYASASEVAMRSIAKQRDVLAERIQVVRDLISATKSAVMGFVNITSLLETQTKTITQSVVSVTDGIRLTLTNSMDVSSVTGSITDKFKEILAKTKQFAVNLRELKRMGLDQNLFKQIVDAGLEAGGTTAAAIIEGGAGTVSELNSLFADLEMTGADIAEQTAQVMYGAGVDITNGLVNGLLAQQDALTAAAKTLADGFTAAFNSQMAEALTANLVAKPFTFMPDYRTSAGSFMAPEIFTGPNANGLRAASVGSPTIFNIDVNAGMGTDGATVGQEIVSAIKYYERTNGAVWVSA